MKYFNKESKSQYIIDVSKGSNETQVVWHILAESGQLPENTRFIKTYDDKTDGQDINKRFKKFAIQEISTKLISSISASFLLYPNTKSTKRELVNKKMEFFLKSGFSILLIGERGTGKSRIASEAEEKSDNKNPFIGANCASFGDDNIAESELFGYEPGTFTGGLTKGKKGLMEQADGGILFLDEVHYLSKLVQGKLMKALQTDEHNRMSIRKMGSDKEIKIECTLIFATNKTIPELRTYLLPDFYDRIVQHVLYIPPLRETKEDRLSDWKTIWKRLKFTGSVPEEAELINWLTQLPLYGNFRDLQKIAIYYNIFNEFDGETKDMLKETTPLQYAKNEFEKYHSSVTQNEKEKYNFNINQTTKQMIADYLFDLQDWAVEKFKSRKKAIEHFHTLNDTVSPETFNNWKNKKPLDCKKEG
jgi:transcriptional regulator with AAA-type ATPase domain